VEGESEVSNLERNFVIRRLICNELMHEFCSWPSNESTVIPKNLYEAR
jgi:hypothetical protein